MAVTDKNIRRWGKELAAEAAAFLHDDEKVIHYIDEHAHILCKSVAYQTFKLLEAKDSDNEARTFYLKIMTENLERKINREADNQYITNLLRTRAADGMSAAHKVRFEEYTDDSGRTQTREIQQKSNRQYSRMMKQYSEAAAIGSKLVGSRGLSTRCTNLNTYNFEQKQLAQDAFLSKNEITDGTKSFKLNTIAEKKQKQLAEIYALAKGIQTFSEKEGKRWMSVVCTLPAAFHPLPESASKTKWNLALPRESADWIQARWVKVRAILAISNIQLSGLWTRESHQDSTPHINFLVYFDEDQLSEIERVFEMHFNHSDKALKIRIGGDVEEGQKAMNFASYAFKYITKFLGKNPTDEATSEAAWASLWSLRRYGWIGLPQLNTYRMLRKSTQEPNDLELKTLWKAARAGDAEAFIRLSGGLNVKRADRPFQVLEEAKIFNKNAAKGTSNLVILNKENGFYHTVKTIGIYTIQQIKKVLTFNLKVQTETNLNMVTVNQSYPSKAFSAAGRSTDEEMSQKWRIYEENKAKVQEVNKKTENRSVNDEKIRINEALTSINKAITANFNAKNWKMHAIFNDILARFLIKHDNYV